MTEVKESMELEPLIGHLVIDTNNTDFLNNTTQAIHDYTKQGYDVTIQYQMALDPKKEEVVHSAYLVGRLKETEPLIDSFELGRLEEWVEQEYTMGEMPNGAYNTIQELLAHYRTK